METDQTDQIIETYIKEKVAKKEQVSLAQFLQDNLEFVLQHTKDDQLDKVERMWGARFTHISQRLNVSVIPIKRSTAFDFQKVVRAFAKKLVSAKPKPTKDSATSSSAAFKDNSHMLTSEARSEFERAYKEMTADKKWEISEGVYVEDLIYEFGKKSTHEHAAHSFILDVSDPIWEKELGKDTLRAICTFGDYSLPPLPSAVKELFNTYANQPENDVLDFLIEKTNELGPFNPRTNEELYKLRNIIEQFVGYYVDDVFQNTKSWTEEDFVTYVWAPLDRLFHSSKVFTTRNQACSATSLRLNGERSISGSSLVGQKKATIRPDLLLIHDNVEYGCSEIGSNLSSVPDKKEIVETKLHSLKTMKDLLKVALSQATNDVEAPQKLKVVCFNQTGLSMSVSVMDNPGGYVSRIVQSEKYKIPVDPEYVVSELFPVLKLALKAKIIVDKSLSVIRCSRLIPKEPGLAFEGIPQKVILPPCLTTPILPATRKRSQSNQSPSTPSKRRSTSNSEPSSSS